MVIYKINCDRYVDIGTSLNFQLDFLCSKCHQSIHFHDKFCKNCGHKLEPLPLIGYDTNEIYIDKQRMCDFIINELRAQEAEKQKVGAK